MGALCRLAAAVLATGLSTSTALAADPPPLPPPAQLHADRSAYVGLVERGLQQTHDLWWNTELDWYNSRPNTTNALPLPSLWYAFPLFEATTAAAIANPTAAARKAVNTFAAKAENYWDPTIAGYTGAYSWYYALRGTGNAYFDDNGWWGIAFLDAYRATQNKRWLTDADKALKFIDRFGWDAAGGGGMWWDLEHHHKTSEPLAAGTMIAAELYAYTRKPQYLKIAKKYLAWANANTVNTAQQNLYGRNATDRTVMDYVEGMMISAHVSLCVSTRVEAYCTKAQRLAEGSLAEFPLLANWSPETDVIYLRGLRDLYSQDGDPRWYAVLYANAQQARTNAVDEQGLWSKRWDGGWALPGAIFIQGATLELFAWVASVMPPASS